MSTQELTCNHNSFRVASQTILEKPGENGVTIGDESILLFRVRRQFSEGGDHRTERDQRLVDVRPFLQPNTRGTCGIGTLTACQIDEVDFTRRLTGKVVLELGLCIAHREDGMRTTKWKRR